MLIHNKSTLLRKPQGMLAVLLMLLILIGQGCQQAAEITVTPTSGSNSTTIEARQTTIKIVTKSAGMYKITAGELNKAGAEGLLNDPTQVHIYNLGNEQPFWTEGQGNSASITFYGAAADSVYSDENSYWLTNDEQLGEKLTWSETQETVDTQALTTEADQAKDQASVMEDGYYATQRFEENNLYAPLVENGDHWFWDKIPGKQKKSYTVALDEVLNGAGIMRIAIWSATNAEISPDHHVTVKINDQPVIDQKWDGSGNQEFSAEIPNGILKEGENQVEVLVPGDTGVRAETNHINWIEIEYPRKYAAINDSLEFTANQTNLKITGLSKNISVFDITKQKDIKQIVERGENENSAFSFEAEPRRAYLAVGSKGYLKPIRMQSARLDSDLRSKSQGADWVAVGPEDLLEAAQPLVDWREKNGLSAMAIPVETIYDQFGFGMPEPQAIREFIDYATENWTPAPQYLLLVGDASYDPKGYLEGAQTNRLPSFFIQTQSSGETASDVKFIEMDSEDDQVMLAKIAIGRIPAQTAKQVETIVEKIIQYESTESTGSEASILAVADGQDPGFAEAAKSFLSIFQPGYKTTLLAPEAGATDVPQQVVKNIKQSDFLVVYFGHGSINMWGKDSLFSIDNVKEVTNLKHYPIMLNFTCLTGLFSHPEHESLAEALLWQAEGGVVAIIAPTSLTLASDQSFLSQPLANAITKTPDAAIGVLLQQVRVDMATEGEGVREVMETFLLLGDPATKLTLP